MVKYLYSVYRTADDRLIALDVTAKEASWFMGCSTDHFYHLLSPHGRKNDTWTIIRTNIADIKKQMEEA